MSQRIKAGLAAVPLLAVMWVLVAVVPLPYVTYYPGPMVDVLGKNDGTPIVQVDGHETFTDGGQLSLTTIYVDQPERKVGLLRLMGAWIDPDAAVYPRSAVYAPDTTDAQDSEMSEILMVSSQDAAVAAALTELGYDLPSVVQVFNVEEGMPAHDKLFFGDRIISVDGVKVKDPQKVGDVVRSKPAGTPLDWVVERGDEQVTVSIAAEEVDGEPRVGITPGPSYDFPFSVRVDPGSGIGGPSAGLIFAMAIYDILTPGSLTSGAELAGTGEITSAGVVRPIGGAQQKVAAARDDGAELFLVPDANCDSLGGVDTGDMRLVSVKTLADALESVQTWVEDPDADLPSCESSD
ncbi:MAG: PDZ domain-containing protein [Nocardioides sp.]|uniref:YlbL family protein n=1 Tax=Nocardioides sp. TaxID=35761 RepID=UPI003F03ACEC